MNFLVIQTRVSECDTAQCSYRFICRSTDLPEVWCHAVNDYLCMFVFRHTRLILIIWGNPLEGESMCHLRCNLSCMMYYGVTAWCLYAGFWRYFLAVLFTFSDSFFRIHECWTDPPLTCRSFLDEIYRGRPPLRGKYGSASAISCVMLFHDGLRITMPKRPDTAQIFGHPLWYFSSVQSISRSLLMFFVCRVPLFAYPTDVLAMRS